MDMRLFFLCLLRHITSPDIFYPTSPIAINGNIFTFSPIKKEINQLFNAIRNLLWGNLAYIESDRKVTV